MRLNQEKCTFWVKADKFLSFYLMKRGIEENPNKYEEFIWMEELTKKRGFMKVNRMLTTLNMFVSKSVYHDIPFYKLSKKEALFQ